MLWISGFLLGILALILFVSALRSGPKTGNSKAAQKRRKKVVLYASIMVVAPLLNAAFFPFYRWLMDERQQHVANVIREEVVFTRSISFPVLIPEEVKRSGHSELMPFDKNPPYMIVTYSGPLTSLAYVRTDVQMTQFAHGTIPREEDLGSQKHWVEPVSGCLADLNNCPTAGETKHGTLFKLEYKNNRYTTYFFTTEKTDVVIRSPDSPNDEMIRTLVDKLIPAKKPENYVTGHDIRIYK